MYLQNELQDVMKDEVATSADSGNPFGEEESNVQFLLEFVSIPLLYRIIIQSSLHS